MKNRIIWGVLIVAAAALLVAGAANRTMARGESGSASAVQSGERQWRGRAAISELADTKAEDNGHVQRQGAGNGQGKGQGLGNGQSRGELADTGSEKSSGQGQGRNGASSKAATEPLANIGGLEILQGAVREVNDDTMLLAQANGDTVEISGRAWRFALENGFTANQKDDLEVVGFYDQDHFEPVAITNETSGQQIQLREATGRPMWAGQGRGRAGT